jgi:hypothetical protein
MHPASAGSPQALLRRKIVALHKISDYLGSIVVISGHGAASRRRDMSKKPKSMENAAEAPAEVPAEVTEFAQKSVDQAQAAFDKASDLAHSNVQYLDAAAGAFKARAADIQLKAMEIAQINMNSALTFVRKAFAVKDPTEFVALNQEFARDQFATFSRQASELSELSVLLAQETVKPVQQSMLKSFGDLGKAGAA